LSYGRVVWDFDGVLADSRAESWRAASELLALLGIEVEISSQETFRRYFTRGGVLPDQDREVLRSMHGLVMQRRANLLETFPCLSLVARLNVPSEIVTSGSAAIARTVLGGRAGLFVNIRGRESGAKGDLFRTLARDAVCITDTVVDVARCRDLSLGVVAVGWGYDTSGALRSSRPDFLVESTAELEVVLGQLELLSGA